MSFLIGILIGVIGIIFAAQNPAVVHVEFLAWNINGSLAIIIFLALLAGMLIGVLIFIPAAIHDSKLFSYLKRHNKKLTAELEAHKEALETTQMKLAQKPPVIIERTIIEK